MFTAENWDPDQWADLFKRAGARFAGPVAEHHDGFPMYDCSFTPYNSVRMGPERDVTGEQKRAFEAAGRSSGKAQPWSRPVTCRRGTTRTSPIETSASPPSREPLRHRPGLAGTRDGDPLDGDRRRAACRTHRGPGDAGSGWGPPLEARPRGLARDTSRPQALRPRVHAETQPFRLSGGGKCVRPAGPARSGEDTCAVDDGSARPRRVTTSVEVRMRSEIRSGGRSRLSIALLT